MSNTCRVCGRPADPFRDQVKVVGMHVEVVCRTCAAAGPQATAAAAAPPAPVAAVSAPAGAPASAGPTALTRGAAAKARPAPPPARSRRAEVIGLIAVMIVGAASIAVALALRSRRAAPKAGAGKVVAKAPAKAAGKKGASIRTLSSGGEASDPEEPPPAGLQAVLDGKWTHPLSGPFRELPPNDTTRFGAYRSREVYKHEYCGSGHCGNDLGNKVGLPVLASRDGKIEKAVYSPTEVEGKWVKMIHPGGLHSYYMHLDTVRPGMEVGTSIAAGTMIGTLGTTGIKRSEPHLHFMISFDAPNGKELFVDPEPLMREAELVEITEVPDWAR